METYRVYAVTFTCLASGSFRIPFPCSPRGVAISGIQIGELALIETWEVVMISSTQFFFPASLSNFSILDCLPQLCRFRYFCRAVDLTHRG
ncbi:hypothetical protein Tsubulata_023129 [Turnera subulata]|uniref:Uncharacterized protein n=1 Tax=Turnera subulata TaxID=218843 RepID=A0A9Q0J0M6_9ROSI|nr:hypothetical protein Tsubulata_023129 [Turnera subulata]